MYIKLINKLLNNKNEKSIIIFILILYIFLQKYINFNSLNMKNMYNKYINMKLKIKTNVS